MASFCQFSLPLLLCYYFWGCPTVLDFVSFSVSILLAVNVNDSVAIPLTQRFSYKLCPVYYWMHQLYSSFLKNGGSFCVCLFAFVFIFLNLFISFSFFFFFFLTLYYFYLSCVISYLLLHAVYFCIRNFSMLIHRGFELPVLQFQHPFYICSDAYCSNHVICLVAFLVMFSWKLDMMDPLCRVLSLCHYHCH